jgi:hypothetical protein
MNQRMQLSDWKVDNSAGRPILTYKGCSVIEAEDAEFVLSAVKAALSDAAPAAYLHTLHMEFDQKEKRVNFRSMDPFGQKGHDYDPSYHVTSEPLYTATHPRLTVAKLKWRHDEYDCNLYTATSPVLTYHTVRLITDGLHIGKWQRSGGDVGVYYDTDGEAMDAEDDDLAQRVRSMIEAPLPSMPVTDEQIIDLLAIHSNHKEKAVARDGSGVIEYEVISHARAIKFARAIVEAAHPARVQDVAPMASPVDAFAEMLDALENARELLEYGGFDLDKIDRAISNGRAIASAVATPARQLTDLGKLEFHLKSLVSAHPEKARMASSREDLRMFFVAELTKVASGRIPLLEIEGLVSRQLAAAKGGEACLSS